jgi:hypothetical protein
VTGSMKFILNDPNQEGNRKRMGERKRDKIK